MERAPYRVPPPPQPVPMALAALGPKMLELARERRAGAHPYFVSSSTRAARARSSGGASCSLPSRRSSWPLTGPRPGHRRPAQVCLPSAQQLPAELAPPPGRRMRFLKHDSRTGRSEFEIMDYPGQATSGRSSKT